MPKESKEVYSGNTILYDANRRYAGLDASSVVGYTPSGNTYYHTSDGTRVYNKKKKGGQSRSKKYGRRKSIHRRKKSACTKRR
jgi:hypothetical protein